MNPIAIHTLSMAHPVWLQWYFEAPSRKSRKVPINFVMCVRLPVCISAALAGRISMKFDFGDLMELYPEKSRFGWNRTEVLDILHEDLSVFFIVGRDMCSTTLQRTHCGASMVTLSVFIALLTSTYGRQQYEGNVLLRFHGNSSYSNAPKCYGWEYSS